MRALIRYLGRHHWGILATFIALGGTAYATTELAPNSVGTKQIRHGAVTIGKISASAQTAIEGAVERAGAGNAFFSTGKPLKVPPGDYIASGGCSADNRHPASEAPSTPLGFGEATAILTTTNADLIEPLNGVQMYAAVPNKGSIDPGGEYGDASLSPSAGFALPKGGTIYLYCEQYRASHGLGGSEQPLTVEPIYLIATRVGTLHTQ